MAVLVLGILGMHALTSHGAAPGPGTVTSMETTSAAQHDHHQIAQGVALATSSTADTAAASVDGSGSGHGLGGMVMLCVVMLAAAALTLLALLATGVVRRLWLRVFDPLTAPIPTLTWVRDTGPPPAWEFSVIRC